MSSRAGVQRAHRRAMARPHRCPAVVRRVIVVGSLLAVSGLCGCSARTTQTLAHDPSPLDTLPPAPARRLDDLLEPIRAQHDLPALAGAIVQGERVVAIGAVGVRKLGSPERVTINDRFHIGSDTKAITATLIAMLVDEGKLSWDTTIADVFPELSDAMQADYRGVTVEQLLSHRGGLPANATGELWRRLWKQEGTPTEQRRALLAGVLREPPAAKPGTRYLYSNVGYAIAGAMTERVTGQAWEDLMRRRLFEPLGMESAGFGAPGTPDRVDEPRGHAVRNGHLEAIEPGPQADNPPAIGPAGTVHCSLGDWAKFIALHLHGARELTVGQASGAPQTAGTGPGRYLKPGTLAKLQTPIAGQDYALGWLVTQRDWGGRVLTHAGSNTMWYAVAWLAPERDFAVLVATNRGDQAAEQGCDEAAAALIRFQQTSGRDSGKH